ncbi:MAG: DUF1778 domain-containing protein [Hyphomicrobiales bacterium]|nr:DUF1778 domain-containing protein [Hyphomicrobiales bacterium]
MTNVHMKKERINLRLQLDAKRKIERAASFEGKKVSQFVLVSALERAEKAIREHEVMTLNAKDSKAFFDALERPVRFNKALSKALKSRGKVVSK